jgi:hypothetical protein
MAWQNIERGALDRHAAGVAGTAGQLQVQAVLNFLLGRAAPEQAARQDAHGDEGACCDAHGTRVRALARASTGARARTRTAKVTPRVLARAVAGWPIRC